MYRNILLEAQEDIIGDRSQAALTKGAVTPTYVVLQYGRQLSQNNFILATGIRQLTLLATQSQWLHCWQ